MLSLALGGIAIYSIGTVCYMCLSNRENAITSEDESLGGFTLSELKKRSFNIDVEIDRYAK